jgi:hypothetical protein
MFQFLVTFGQFLVNFGRFPKNVLVTLAATLLRRRQQIAIHGNPSERRSPII